MDEYKEKLTHIRQNNPLEDVGEYVSATNEDSLKVDSTESKASFDLQHVSDEISCFIAWVFFHNIIEKE